MLVESYRKKLQRSRRLTLFALIGTLGAIVGMYQWMLRANGPVVPGIVCISINIFLAVFIFLPRLWARPGPTYPIFNRQVVRERLSDSPMRDSTAAGRILTRFGGELDELAQRLGAEPLGRFLHLGGLAQGVAHHEPARGIATVDALLRDFESHAPRFEEPEAVQGALEELRADLKAAEGCGARFCLMPVSAWSGLAETTLKLFFGTQRPR
jgi:hypothetical protein